MTELWKRAAEAATVRLPALGGQGVLTSGEFILTAAHRIQRREHDNLFLGDEHLAWTSPKRGSSRAAVSGR